MWDERYSAADFAYGDRPNDFLVERAAELTRGSCLCLAEGQGRNAVWLAQQGLSVTAIDQSEVGMRSATALAAQRCVAIETAVADLVDYDLGTEKWDTIISIFGHLPPTLRADVNRRIVNALKPGGAFLLEAYTPGQLDMKGVGGPSDGAMLMRADMLREELAGLDFLVAQETEREVDEGQYHHGLSAVVQILARKPIAE